MKSTDPCTLEKFRKMEGIHDFQGKFNELSKSKDWINIKRSVMRAPQIFKQKLNIGTQMEPDSEFDALYERFQSIHEDILTFQLEITRYSDMVREFVRHTIDTAEALSKVFHDEAEEDEAVAKGYSELCIMLKVKWQAINEQVDRNLDLNILLVKEPLVKIGEICKHIKLYITEREFAILDIDKYSKNVHILKEKIEKEATLSLKQQQNLVRYQKNLELGKIKYERYNDSLKMELPTFFELVNLIMSPLTITEFFLQLTNSYYFLGINEIPDPLFKLRTKENEMNSQTFFDSIVRKYHKTHMKTKSLLEELKVIKSRDEVALESELGSFEQPTDTKSEAQSSIRTVQNICEASYDFMAQEPGDLSFKRGDKIRIIDNKSSGAWWKGELNNKIGIFPKNYVKL